MSNRAWCEGCHDAALADLTGKLAAAEQERDEAQKCRRWNVQGVARGDLEVCFGEHDKALDCPWEPYVPKSRALAAALALDLYRGIVRSAHGALHDADPTLVVPGSMDEDLRETILALGAKARTAEAALAEAKKDNAGLRVLLSCDANHALLTASERSREAVVQRAEELSCKLIVAEARAVAERVGANEFLAKWKDAEAALAEARGLVKRFSDSGCWYLYGLPPANPCPCGPCEAYRFLARPSAEPAGDKP